MIMHFLYRCVYSFMNVCILFYILNVVLTVKSKALPPDTPLLLLISMDGFRHDYLSMMNRNNTEHFQYFIDNGVRAKNGIMNVFPSSTYPNHLTLITGTYPDFHGMVNNYFYDPYFDEYFNMHNLKQNLESKWVDYGSEPITVTNMKRAGRHSGSILWPTGLAPVKCKQPRILPNVSWDSKHIPTWTERIDTILSWFGDDFDPINMGLLYFEEPDEVGHHFGPNSPELKEKIVELNNALGYLRQQLEKKGLLEKMNVIITADHGMAEFGGVEKTIVIDELLNSTWFKTASKFHNGIVPQIVPINDHRADIEGVLFGSDNKTNNHTGYYAWYREGTEMKKRHYSNSRRIKDILLEAKKGWSFASKGYTIQNKGLHGYDPLKFSEMHPFFIASGPAFKKGYVIDTFDSVDIYPLMCHILGLIPAPNSGILSHVESLLKNPPVWYKSFETTAVTFLCVVILAALVGGVFGIAACRQNRIYRRKYMRVNRIRSLNSPVRSLPETDSMLKSDTEEEDDF